MGGGGIVFLFILFGSFLEHAGMISLFNNIALAARHARNAMAATCSRRISVTGGNRF